MQQTVSVVPCSAYESAVCRDALIAALAPLGGLEWVKPGMKIAIKVNLVAPMRPDQAATTHPVLLGALCELLTERGASVSLGDSPGGLFTAAYLNHVYEVTGLQGLVQDGISLNQNFSQKDAFFPAAVQAKRFTYTAWLDEADAIIDFCKLKTHGQMGMTCAVKNFFGSIPGTMKPEYHYRFPNPADFANMLVDLYEFFKPRLCICDAVVCMEGNGPTQGTPRKVGAVLASTSGHALDLAGAAILGFSPQEVPTLAAAISRSLVPENLSDIEIIGNLQQFLQTDVKRLPAQKSISFIDGNNLFSKALRGAASRILTPYPKLHKELCVGCEKCKNICPAKAITMQNRLPMISRSACIHCFCCQEFCPKGAMQVGRSKIARILNK